MKTCVVTNRKGGVGKTTLALHLAAAGHEAGRKTLLVDLDPQGSASGVLLPDGTDSGLAETLWDSEAGVVPALSSWGFDVLAASPALSGAEALSLDDNLAAIRRVPAGYDLVVYDTPPYFGTLQTAPLLVADLLIAPVEPDVFALRGLSALQDVVGSVKDINPRLQFRVVVNRLKSRAGGQQALAVELEKALANRVVQPALAEREGVRKARDAGVPVWQFAKSQHYAQDWKSVSLALID